MWPKNIRIKINDAKVKSQHPSSGFVRNKKGFCQVFVVYFVSVSLFTVLASVVDWNLTVAKGPIQVKSSSSSTMAVYSRESVVAAVHNDDVEVDVERVDVSSHFYLAFFVLHIYTHTYTCTLCVSLLPFSIFHVRLLFDMRWCFLRSHSSIWLFQEF